MGKTCPSLSNYKDTRYWLKLHLIRQENPVTLQVPSHIGLVCLLNCSLHCLGARPETYHSATTSFLFVYFIHKLNLIGQPSTRTNSFLYCQVEFAFSELFRCGVGCLIFPVAPLDTRYHSQVHRYNLLTYIRVSCSILRWHSLTHC